jgi:hypothetical protein
MRHPLNRPTPRTLNEAFGTEPWHYDPFEHYTKPLTQRLFFWALAALAAVLLIGIIYA